MTRNALYDSARRRSRRCRDDAPGDGHDQQRAGTGSWCGCAAVARPTAHSHQAPGCSIRGRYRRSSAARMRRSGVGWFLARRRRRARRRRTDGHHGQTTTISGHRIAAETPESWAAALVAAFAGWAASGRGARRAAAPAATSPVSAAFAAAGTCSTVRAAPGGGVAVDRAGQALVHAHLGDGREDLGAGGLRVHDGAGGLRRRGSGAALGVRRATGVDAPRPRAWTPPWRRCRRRGRRTSGWPGGSAEWSRR